MNMTAVKTLLWSVFVPGTLTTLVPYLLLRWGPKLPPVELSGFRLAGLIPIAGLFQVFDGTQVVSAGILRPHPTKGVELPWNCPLCCPSWRT